MLAGLLIATAKNLEVSETVRTLALSVLVGLGGSGRAMVRKIDFYLRETMAIAFGFMCELQENLDEWSQV